MRSVLFVCTGNSCRSVMAEGLLKKALQRLGKDDIKVSSAGVLALEGRPPTPETIEVMQDEGVDVSEHRATYLTDEMIAETDIIIVMEELHRFEITSRIPEAADKIFLLREYAGRKHDRYHEGGDVPDPIGRSIREYQFCLKMIKNEVEQIAELL